MKLWEGRFKKELDSKTNDFNASIHFDKRLYEEDIIGSIAHVKMLGEQGIIRKEESEKLINELKKIREEIEKGSLEIDLDVEDIHSFIEKELTIHLGDTGKRVHTARSRNDQVALDMRLYIRKETNNKILNKNALIVTECQNQNKQIINKITIKKYSLIKANKRRNEKSI